MFLVESRQGLRIKKDGGGALETNPMVLEVPPGLDRVPFKYIMKPTGHLRIVTRNLDRAKVPKAPCPGAACERLTSLVKRL